MDGRPGALRGDAQLPRHRPHPWDGQRAAFRATTELKRSDFAVDWNQSLPGGAMLIGSVVQITLDIEAVQGDLPEMPDA